MIDKHVITLKKWAIRTYINTLGWNTNRQIVIIESDDWGSIRMPSNEILREIEKKGYLKKKLPYLQYDTIEGNDDLNYLFDLLKSHTDAFGNHPVFTANTIVGNPDFKKIEAKNFQEYFYEPFTETLKSYENRDKVLSLYKKGIEEKIFHPQFHGREHLNVKRWMRALQSNNAIARNLFNYKLYDLSESHTQITRNKYVDALSLDYPDDFNFQEKSIKEGLALFEKIFHYPSKSFIAPCYVWSSEVERVLVKNGINHIQSNVYQLIPKPYSIGVFRKRLHYTGEKNRKNQIYTVRNCTFEPSVFEENCVDNCLQQINRAFSAKKPAIICSHRLNYIGTLDERNREKNLGYLNILLRNIIKKWPRVEFMTTENLGKAILEDRLDIV